MNACKRSMPVSLLAFQQQLQCYLLNGRSATCYLHWINSQYQVGRPVYVNCAPNVTPEQP